MPEKKLVNRSIKAWQLALVSWLFISLGTMEQPALADAKLEGTNPAQFRLIWLTDPATEAIVSWNTAQPGTNHAVRYGIRGTAARTEQAAQRNGRFTGEIELYYHHAALKGLRPETEYELEMISDGRKSPLLYFKTAPAEDRPLSILFGGDSRSDQHTRRRMNEMMARMVLDSSTTDERAQEIFALAHGGDYIAQGHSLVQWSRWASDHELTIGEDGRLLPILPARGNHDGGPIFNELFAFPENDLNYYTVHIGPQVCLITLNTETSAGGEQADFLEEQLKAKRQNVRWLLAQYHRPVYPALKGPCEGRRFWVPLFEQFHVDLACEADGHVIKRTVPIRGDKPDETGVVYIGEGGLGVPQRRPDKQRWFLAEPGMAASGHHVQLLTFTENELKYQCVLLGGSVIDTFTRKPWKERGK